MCKSNLPRHFRPKKGLIIIAGLVTSCLGGFVSPVYADNMVCYAIADNDRYGNKDQLLKVDASTGELVGDPKPTNTTKVEASTFDCEGGRLYVVDGGVLGTLDLNDADEATFSPISPPEGLGFGKGIKGVIDINDIDGLAFDCATNKLYGTHRVEESGPVANNDLLVEIDPTTGELVKNAFGKNKDYVPVIGSQPDIDDIAWDPGPTDDNDKELFAIANQGMGKNSYLGNLEKTDADENTVGGMPTGNVVLQRASKTVDDIESLTFASEPNADGTFSLYGTTGDSIGAGNTSTAHRLYKINKTTGATTPLGQSQALSKGDNPQYDFEAAACRSEIPTCVLYAVHDENRVDSQVIRIDPFTEDQKVSLQMFGPLHEKVDIEGLVIVPSKPGDTGLGKFYGFAGGDNINGDSYQGVVYTITREGSPLPGAGQITPLGGSLVGDGFGLTGFMEVSAAGLQYVDTNSDGIMDATQAWGWARKNHSPNQPAYTRGPITVDLVTGAGTKQGPAINMAPPGVPFPDLESIAMSNDGKTLYGVQYVNKKTNDPDYPNGTHLWAYDVATKKLTPQCFENGQVHPFIHAEVEGLEMQANGLLLFAIYYQGDWGFGALDPQDCKIKATRTFKGSDYLYDLESIELPTDECRGRSYLYEGSGDAIIEPLPEYEDVPDDVVEAMEEALGEGDGVEAIDGVLNVFVGMNEYIVLPTIFDDADGNRAGTRSEECPISNAQLSAGVDLLTYTDCTGDHKVGLTPVPVSRKALLEALSQFGEVTIEGGIVKVTFADGSIMTARLSPLVGTIGSLNLSADITANIVPLENGNINVVYSVGQQQTLIVNP